MRTLVVALQQRQEQERITEKVNVVSTVNETPSGDTVVQVTCDAVQLSSASCVTTTAMSSAEAPPIRPLIPFGQAWLAGSSK